MWFPEEKDSTRKECEEAMKCMCECGADSWNYHPFGEPFEEVGDTKRGPHPDDTIYICKAVCGRFSFWKKL